MRQWRVIAEGHGTFNSITRRNARRWSGVYGKWRASANRFIETARHSHPWPGLDAAGKQELSRVRLLRTLDQSLLYTPTFARVFFTRPSLSFLLPLLFDTVISLLARPAHISPSFAVSIPLARSTASRPSIYRLKKLVDLSCRINGQDLCIDHGDKMSGSWHSRS